MSNDSTLVPASYYCIINLLRWINVYKRAIANETIEDTKEEYAQWNKCDGISIYSKINSIKARLNHGSCESLMKTSPSLNHFIISFGLHLEYCITVT